MQQVMKQPIITIRDLGVVYDSVNALEHVDLDIYADDFLGIIGPNGGGKSSLVKAIMGIVPHSGTINFDASIIRHGFLSRKWTYLHHLPKECVLVRLRSMFPTVK